MNIAQRLAFLWCGFCLLHYAPVQAKLRVAEQKCLEYIDQNTQQSYGGTLSLNPDVIQFKAANCSTSVDLIINGVEALVGEFPHQAVLGKPKNGSAELEYYCGGSLISERFVLTAAHCPRPTIVRLGVHNLTDVNDNEVDCMVSDYIRHPSFTISKAYFDLALVQLSIEVDFFPEIRPACLWTSDPFNYSTVVASGFGATEHGPNSTVLMKVRLNVMDKAKCEDKFFGYRKLDDGIMDEQMCVGSQEGGRDTCNGDSGGPIQVATDLETCAYYVVGITSSGGACGIGTSESVYTKVASYVDWIEQHVWPDEWIQSREIESKEAEPTNYRIYFPGNY
ncbi:serine protease snake-like [Ochlerotatus camptorhynchus]|uniref:serine protease snake-like n=1 Tax=Ochlerotatus camptorhynchus TaxID=644619 RepID=UPI0031E43802